MHTIDTIIVAPSTGRLTYSSFPTPEDDHCTTMDVVPVGTSPVASPWFTFIEWDHATDERTEWYGSYLNSADEPFYPYAWPGGYAMQYVGDCDVHCYECARQHWEETGERYRPYASEGDYPESVGVYCGSCNVEIVTPHCLECGSEDYSGAWFESDSGDYRICGHCLAEYVISGDAVKTDLNRYEGNANTIHAWAWQGIHATMAQREAIEGYHHGR